MVCLQFAILAVVRECKNVPLDAFQLRVHLMMKILSATADNQPTPALNSSDPTPFVPQFHRDQSQSLALPLSSVVVVENPANSHGQ